MIVRKKIERKTDRIRCNRRKEGRERERGEKEEGEKGREGEKRYFEFGVVLQDIFTPRQQPRQIFREGFKGRRRQLSVLASLDRKRLS